MADAKAAWDEVGERFAALGRRIKERYDARAAFGDEEKAQVEEALKRLSETLESTFGAIGETMRDPEIRSEVKGTAACVGDALATTFRELADLIDEKLGRTPT